MGVSMFLCTIVIVGALCLQYGWEALALGVLACLCTFLTAFSIVAKDEGWE